MRFVVGAAGTVTAQNIGAMGKAADGYVTGAAYSPELDTPANKAFVKAFKAAWKAEPDLYGVDSYGVVYFYKAAAEKAKSTDREKVRDALVSDAPSPVTYVGEKPKALLVRQVAKRMRAARSRGAKVLAVCGPAVVHTGGAPSVARLVSTDAPPPCRPEERSRLHPATRPRPTDSAP